MHSLVASAAMQRRAGIASLLRSARVKMNLEKYFSPESPGMSVDTDRIEPRNLVAQRGPFAPLRKGALDRCAERPIW